MEFYDNQDLDFNDFKAVLSCWRGEPDWCYLQQGFPVLIQPKVKAKAELRMLRLEENGQMLVDTASKKLKIRVDEYAVESQETGKHVFEKLFSVL